MTHSLTASPGVDTIRTAIRQRILADYLFTDDPSALDDAESFRDSRIIDSMGMMELIEFIEREFKIGILETEMVPENLNSVDLLVAFIQEKRRRS